MKKSDVFPSKFLSASDLNGKPVVLTIADARMEPLKNQKGEEQNKMVLYFKGATKALPLNMVNFDSVADIAGDDTDNWRGARIEVYPTTTTMGGKTVDCIRIRRPPQAALPLRNFEPPPVTDLPEDRGDALPW